MTARCPKCSTELPATELNVAANVAYCRACNEVFPLSEVVRTGPRLDAGAVVGPAPEIDLNRPPSGVRYEQTFDGVIVSATTRSCIAVVLIPFMCFWSGGSLGGIYGSQLKSGKFDPGLCLFSIPFIIGTLLFGSYALMTLFGRVELRMRGDDGEIFTGLGPLGSTKRFKLSEVTGVREEVRRTSKGGTTYTLVLEGVKQIEFGSMLSNQRRAFMLAVLKKVIGQR